MKTKIQLAFILLSVAAVFSNDNPYCLLESCPNDSHTLCKFTETKPADSCGDTTWIGLKIYEMQELLQMHNILRKYPYLNEQEEDSEVNSDDDTDFIQLEWDDELARSAQRWAQQCSNVTDECRNDDRFNVTQRVGVYDNYIKYNVEPQMYGIVFDWYRQEDAEKRKSIESGSESSSNTNSNHHTHTVWGRATLLGCGGVRTADETKNYLYIACNYAPYNQTLE